MGLGVGLEILELRNIVLLYKSYSFPPMSMNILGPYIGEADEFFFFIYGDGVLKKSMNRLATLTK
jgi:hypothetical protein